MGNQGDNKFTWVIKKFCSLQSGKIIYSDEFFVDGCKWRLMAVPEGNDVEHLSLYLDVAGSEFLPDGWRRHVDFHLSLVNQLSEELSQTKAAQHWFAANACNFGFRSMFPLNKLHDKDGGFLVNGEVKIVAEVSVLEVIGKLDIPEESEETAKALSKIEEKDGAESNGLHKEASSVKESTDVNGFRVLPSQVESVRRIFERYPDIAVQFRAKNQLLRNACMNFLLSLIETMCQSLQELSNEDLVEADIALTYLRDAGFKVDWLAKKLNQLKERKEEEQSGLARLHEIEENLMILKQKRSDLDALAEKEKAELSATRTSMSFDDLVC